MSAKFHADYNNMRRDALINRILELELMVNGLRAELRQDKTDARKIERLEMRVEEYRQAAVRERRYADRMHNALVRKSNGKAAIMRDFEDTP